MIHDLDAMVSEVCDFLDIKPFAEFVSLLRQKTENSKQYKSEHIYSLEAIELNKNRTLKLLQAFFEFYEFGAEKTVPEEKDVFLRFRDRQLARKQRRRLRAKKTRNFRKKTMRLE